MDGLDNNLGVDETKCLKYNLYFGVDELEYV